MSYTVEKLAEDDEQAYDQFLREIPSAMLYASLAYRNLLRDFLAAEDHYFLAKDGAGNIVGALPSFLKKIASKGNVLNSLPFYGSYGGFITRDNQKDVAQALLNAFQDFSYEKEVISSTLVVSPFEENIDLYLQLNKDFLLKTSRIGQINFLPKPGDDLRERVLMSIPQKTRNMVRKAIKLGLTVTNDKHDDSISFLAQVHTHNMRDIGGLAKPSHFFEQIDKHFKYGSEYKIFIARYQNKPIAALLLFYFNKTVEYFTPVIVKEYRSYQPMSLLIYEAMVEAIEKNYSIWNWGGTWPSQDGVYRFKKSWGALDKPYDYFTMLYNQNVFNRSKEELLADYPYFYVVPFSRLIS